MGKVGIITMHRVLNYGSALQAYALQYSIEKLGYDVELIDYKFPPKQKMSLLSWLRYYTLNFFAGFPIQKKRKNFNSFYQKYYHCSNQTFNSLAELKNADFDYNLYITGSDQVWNPKHIKDDTSFLLSFVTGSSKYKISYAASFATNEIKNCNKTNYKKYLNLYDYISVREDSGVEIVKELIGKNADVLCDPTLLLNAKDWEPIVSDQFKRKVPSKYILVYALVYAYNPYPYMNDIIDEVQKRLGMHVIFLDGSLNDYKRRNSTIIKSAGPADFLYLIKNADFIITTSFHGTSFALNFDIPFYSIVRDLTDQDDSRMLSLLHKVGAFSRAKQYNKPLLYDDLFDKCEYGNPLSIYRGYSKDRLTMVLNKFCNNKGN